MKRTIIHESGNKEQGVKLICTTSEDNTFWTIKQWEIFNGNPIQDKLRTDDLGELLHYLRTFELYQAMDSLKAWAIQNNDDILPEVIDSICSEYRRTHEMMKNKKKVFACTFTDSDGYDTTTFIAGTEEEVKAAQYKKYEIATWAQCMEWDMNTGKRFADHVVILDGTRHYKWVEVDGASGYVPATFKDNDYKGMSEYINERFFASLKIEVSF